MKKLFIMAVGIAFSGTVLAQTGDPTRPGTGKEKSTKSEVGVKEEKPMKSDVGVKEEKTEKKDHDKYECPKCHMTSDKPGTCGMCKIDMIESKGEMKVNMHEGKEQEKKPEEKH